MKLFRKIQNLMFMSCFCIATLNAQETIPATGGEVSGSGGTVSYSIGQITWNTFSGAIWTVAQGVQQPYEISVVTGMSEIGNTNLECTVFPNPTKRVVKLLVKSFDSKNLSFQLTDLDGALIRENKIESNETEISMDNLVPAIYFLKISLDNSEIKVFKIIKN
jgi:hypothetical protein